MAAPDDRIESCIEQLVADARPVRRLRSPAVRLLAWVGVVLAVAAVATTAGLRRDVAARIASPIFLAELACLGAAAIGFAGIALGGAVPGLHDARGRRALPAILLAGGLVSAAWTGFPFATSFAGFVERGVACAVSSVVLAFVPWAVLLWAVRRGLPLRPGRTFAAGGLAASLAAYALMRLRCSADDVLHVAVWHGGPVVIATCAAAVVGVVLTRRPVATASR
jgi:hypothetical protein